ncbi:MAG: hypothetical protein M1818_006028 [Claussenomyces sp. TS43310]|nr:MAG: hypothetical protein M1818_006028 [Claussenomyces sp. TS43310]
MSLNPEDSRRRGRSRSPGRRDERARSRSRVDESHDKARVAIDQAPSPASARYGARYDDQDDGERRRYEYREETVTKSTSARDEPRYVPESSYRVPSPPGRQSSYVMPGGFGDEEGEKDVRARYSDGKEKTYYDERKPTKKEDYSSGSESSPERWQPKRKAPEVSSFTKQETYRIAEADPRDRETKRYEEDKYGRAPSPSYGHRKESPPIPKPMRQSYAEPKRFEYAQPEEKISYSSRTETYGAQAGSYERPSHSSPHGSQTQIPATNYASPHSSQHEIPGTYGAPTRSSREQIVTVEPGQRRTSGAASLAPRMSSLSVSAGHGSAPSLAAAPGSPLLEAYHGTYQSISPMPSPLMAASTSQYSQSNIDMLDIGPPSPGKRKHARFHDPESDAALLAKALKGNRAPDTDPLIEILPALTHEQIMDLRVEYKRMVKTGSEKKGVNIAKHIKLRLKEEDPSLMKACYAVALGKWESEAYWANFWYQGEKSRRELLIESLMGRTNAEIRAIKDGFSDKKYSDSLTKCMKTELREDKFKKAILLVLEERRMEDEPYSLDHRLIEDDVRDLHRAVRSEKGGESAMIGIIVLRSDSHLREVMRMYEATYRANFAREMLRKSGNLVGELLAHILNGVINRPVRDALLLNHALTLTKSDSLRTELLISRLVRYHWDGAHMEAVKREYRTRYGKELQQAVRDGSRGSWGEFCEELCVMRMPDDVRRVERVEKVQISGGYGKGGGYR